MLKLESNILGCLLDCSLFIGHQSAFLFISLKEIVLSSDFPNTEHKTLICLNSMINLFPQSISNTVEEKAKWIFNKLKGAYSFSVL